VQIAARAAITKMRRSGMLASRSWGDDFLRLDVTEPFPVNDGARVIVGATVVDPASPIGVGARVRSRPPVSTVKTEGEYVCTGVSPFAVG